MEDHTLKLSCSSTTYIAWARSVRRCHPGLGAIFKLRFIPRCIYRLIIPIPDFACTTNNSLNVTLPITPCPKFG